MTTVFLTGGTGFLGRQLAVRLAVGGADVLLLARRNSRRAARTWLSAYRMADPVAAGRIRLLVGDLSEPGILEDRAVERVVSSTDTIVHCAAATAPDVDRAYAWRHTVRGTEALLRLAGRIPGLRRFLHVSDAGVAGDHVGPFSESELLVGQGFSGPRLETKAIAERHVRAAAASMPVTIVRPSWIVGDRVTGEVGRPIGLYRLLLPLVRLARLPRALRVVPVVPGGSNRRADAVPVDWVVDAIEAMLADPTATGTFHLTSPDAPTVRELLAQVGDHFGGMTLGPDVPLTSPRGRIAGATTGATFDTSNASRILRPLGLEAPILQDYLAPILEYARRHLV